MANVSYVTDVGHVNEEKLYFYTHVFYNLKCFPKTKNLVGLQLVFPSQDIFLGRKKLKGLTSGQWFVMFWQTLTQAVWFREKET